MKIPKSNISKISSKPLFGDISIMPSDTVYGFFVCALSQSSVESLGFVEPYEPVFARIKNTVSKMYVL